MITKPRRNRRQRRRQRRRCSGNGSDIFESFVGSIIAAMVIARGSKISHYPPTQWIMSFSPYCWSGRLHSLNYRNFLYDCAEKRKRPAALRNTTFIGAILFWAGVLVQSKYSALTQGLSQCAVILGKLGWHNDRSRDGLHGNEPVLE